MAELPDPLAFYEQPDDAAATAAEAALAESVERGYVEIVDESGDGGTVFRFTEAGKRHMKAMSRVPIAAGGYTVTCLLTTADDMEAYAWRYNRAHPTPLRVNGRDYTRRVRARRRRGARRG